MSPSSGASKRMRRTHSCAEIARRHDVGGGEERMQRAGAPARRAPTVTAFGLGLLPRLLLLGAGLRGAARHLVEDRLGRFAAHDRVRDGVGVLLV
jgi:hypothetical protein